MCTKSTCSDPNVCGILPLRVACGEIRQRQKSPSKCKQHTNQQDREGSRILDNGPFIILRFQSRLRPREAGKGLSKTYQGILRSFCVRARVSSLWRSSVMFSPPKAGQGWPTFISYFCPSSSSSSYNWRTDHSLREVRVLIAADFGVGPSVW